MKSSRSLLAGLIALVLLAPAARAQSADSSASVAGAAASVVAASAERVGQPERPEGPTRDAAVVGIRPSGAAETVVPATVQQQGGSFGRAETLMIVGGAAFVAGLIIGDDAGTIVMVGGAAIGLYGLYLYLQTH